MTGTYGQDWASYQASAPSTAGLGFVFVKATEGTGYTNPLHAAQIAHGRANGLVVGHYHYPHMGADPAVEVAFFLSVAKPLPGDLLVLDWEGYDAANKGVPFARQIAYKVAFLARLAAAAPTLQRITYCNTDYLNRDPHGEYGDALWIATANKPAGQPGISRTWLFHQYGASGVDKDYSPLTVAQLKTWAHAKENDDMALTPTEHQMLTEMHDAFMKFRGWDYSSSVERKADPHSPDAWGKLTATLATSKATLAAVKAGAPPTLTDDQVAALAERIVPVLVPQFLAAMGHALDGTKP